MGRHLLEAREMRTAAFDQLHGAMRAGRGWEGMGDSERARALLKDVFEERYAKRHWDSFLTRTNLQTKEGAASYAGYILGGRNDTHGAYEGTSFVWFPGEGGSVAVLVIGTQGFGDDAHILGRPGHRRRLAALARMNPGKVWVKADPLDRSSRVPDSVVAQWPEIKRAVDAYGDVIYAAVGVRDDGARAAVEDLMALFFHEHGTEKLKEEKKRWEDRERRMRAALFPRLETETIAALVRERRFVVLEGPPGTGKTRAAELVAKSLGTHAVVQFHPARTYEDFVVGLAPRTEGGQLAFEVRPGDLLVANEAAGRGAHTLVIDEINRGDLSRVLGEAVYLFEPGAPERTVRLPHAVKGTHDLRLEPTLMVLGTRNTADRSIAAIDVALRRRFAFLPMWPDPEPVEAEGDALAMACFSDTLYTFTEFCDDEALRLVPGHAYFLDPTPHAGPADRGGRIRRRLAHELLPLLHDYVGSRLVGPATSDVQGLADRIATRLDAAAA